jgi:hypothetical protein
MFKVPNYLALATLSPPESPKFRFRFNVVPLLPIVFLAPPFILKNQLKSRNLPMLFKFYYGLILVLE